MSTYHVPVMLTEVLEALDVAPGRRVVDATLGGAGHAAEIAKRIAPGGILIGLDQDADALAEAGDVLKAVPETVTTHLVQMNFAEIREALAKLEIASVDGVLMDLGVSSHQLDTPNRGFSFRGLGPLDMRMQAGGDGETAADLLNRLPEAEIARILFTYGEESRGRRIASEIVRRRQIKPLATTEDLADAVRGAMPYRTRPGEIHPATRTFQAIRIAVNRELEVLETALREAAQALHSGGRLVVIAYHSLEDRIVKNVFAELSGKRVGSDLPDPEPVAEPILNLITRKPLVPTDDEVRRNPRSRSAKLRVAEKR